MRKHQRKINKETEKYTDNIFRDTRYDKKKKEK